MFWECRCGESNSTSMTTCICGRAQTAPEPEAVDIAHDIERVLLKLNNRGFTTEAEIAAGVRDGSVARVWGINGPATNKSLEQYGLLIGWLIGQGYSDMSRYAHTIVSGVTAEKLEGN